MRDRQDYLFGTESPFFFFAQPVQLSALCGVCVDGEEIYSDTTQLHHSGTAACFSKDRVSFRNKQWLPCLLEYLPTATGELNLSSGSLIVPTET